jgi:elongation factor Tu
MLTPQEGGKTSAVRGLCRPNHNFGGADNRELWFGQIQLGPGERIEPGERREVVIEFPDDGRLLKELYPGRIWKIQEGPKVVATATLVEAFDGT